MLDAPTTTATVKLLLLTDTTDGCVLMYPRWGDDEMSSRVRSSNTADAIRVSWSPSNVIAFIVAVTV
jgi:hypothetical protein